MTENQLNTPDEIWKAIPGFEAIYDVSNQGRVRSYWKQVRKSTGYGSESFIDALPQRILRQFLDRYGYPTVNLTKEGKMYVLKIHRLVLETFIGARPPRMECCHDDGNKRNNFVANLKWGTSVANTQDSIRHGTLRGTFEKGANHPRPTAKLSEDQVLQIRSLYPGKSMKEIGMTFGVTSRTIGQIIQRKRWKHI